MAADGNPFVRRKRLSRQCGEVEIPKLSGPRFQVTLIAGNTSYHFAASRTVFPRVSPYHGPGPFASFGSRI